MSRRRRRRDLRPQPCERSASALGLAMARFAVFGVVVPLGPLGALGALGVLAALSATPSGTAAARPASTGWFAEGGLGAVKFLPKASADAALGPSLNLHVGRDLFSWLSIGVDLAASSHEATVPPPPVGEWFQLYRACGDARIAGSFDRFGLFVEGGAGIAMISSNVLGRVMITDPGQRVAIAFQGG